MVPRYYNPQLNAFVSSIHSWLIRTSHHTVLIDTCVGNHKDRPEFPRFNRLDVPWLDRLAAAGVTPEQVDLVCAPTSMSTTSAGTRGLTTEGGCRPFRARNIYLAGASSSTGPAKARRPWAAE